METRKKGRGIGDHKTGESKQFLKRKEITKRMLLENKNLYRAKSLKKIALRSDGALYLAGCGA